MQKTNPTMIVAAVVGVVLIVGLIVFVSLGGKRSSERKVEELKARADQADSARPQLSFKEQREHLKRTELALKGLETKKQKEEEEEAKKAAEQEEEERKKRAAAAAGGPAPGTPGVSAAEAERQAERQAKKQAATKKQADSLDSIGKDIASELSGP